jgi:hypothetical protein
MTQEQVNRTSRNRHATIDRETNLKAAEADGRPRRGDV